MTALITIPVFRGHAVDHTIDVVPDGSDFAVRVDGIVRPWRTTGEPAVFGTAALAIAVALESAGYLHTLEGRLDVLGVDR